MMSGMTGAGRAEVMVEPLRVKEQRSLTSADRPGLVRPDADVVGLLCNSIRFRMPRRLVISRGS